MRNLIAGCLFFALASPASAALAPEYQRQREIQAVITNPEVREALKGHPISAVTWTGDDRVEVTGGACTVKVSIVGTGKPGDPPGPRKFAVEVTSAGCKN